MWLPQLKQSHLDLLGRAKLRSAESRPRQDGRTLVCGFRLQREQRAASRMRFRFVDSQHGVIPHLSSGITNEAGAGLVFCDQVDRRGLWSKDATSDAVLQTSPLEAESWTVVSGPIQVPTSGTIRSGHDGGWALDVYRDVERPRSPSTGSAGDPARVAIAGRPRDLEKVYPYFRGRTCTRIAALVVEGDLSEITTPGWLRVEPIAADELDPAELADLTAVIDLAGLPVLEAAREGRFHGRAIDRPIVLQLSPHRPDFTRLLDFFEQRFIGPPPTGAEFAFQPEETNRKAQ